MAAKSKNNTKKNEIDWDAILVASEDLKIAVSIRLDPEVLAYFKAEGRGYQTRINAVLRSFVDAQK